MAPTASADNCPANIKSFWFYLLIGVICSSYIFESIACAAGVRMRPRLMASSQTSQAITVLSYSNGSLNVSVSGGVVNISPWREIGTDNPSYPRAAYVATVGISGLSPHTGYTYTISQVGEVESYSGSFTTLPPIGADVDFSFILYTCDWFFNQLPVTWNYIKAHVNDPEPILFMIGQDDVGYLDDRANVDDSTGVSGMVLGPVKIGDLQQEWGYAFGWLMYWGMVGRKAPSDERWWVYENMPLFAMWGDHEIDHNFRQSHNGSFSQIDYNKSRVVWDALFGDAMPAPLTGGSFSVPGGGSFPYMYFGVKAGELTWVQADRNSHACYEFYEAGNANSNFCSTNMLPVQLLGATQINSITNWLDNTQTWFKLFSASNSLKNVQADLTGAQEPWKDTSGWLPDYNLFKDTVKSKGTLNGSNGQLFYYQGNTHNAQIFDHDLDGEGVHLWEFVSGATHLGNHTSAPIGSVYDDSTVVWTNNSVAGQTANQAFLHVTVYGSRSPKELVVRQIDKFGNVAWQGVLTEGTGTNNFQIQDVDHDNDGLADAFEGTLGTNPLAVDSDADGLVDGQDGVVTISVYPTGIDANGDGFVDGELTVGTNPLLNDSDGDGLDDGLEIVHGTNPLDGNSWPNLMDGDLAPLGNPDGLINAGDILVGMRIVMGMIPPGSLELAHGDMNADGAINLTDLIKITKTVLN